MAALAVGGLEVVDVEQDDRYVAALAARASELELEDAADRPLVGEAGQRVGVRHALEPVGAFRGGRRETSAIDRDREEVREDRDEARRRLVGRRPPGPANEQRTEDEVDAGGFHEQWHAQCVTGPRRTLFADGLRHMVRGIGGGCGEGRSSIGLEPGSAGELQIGQIGILEEDDGIGRAGGVAGEPNQLVDGAIEVGCAGGAGRGGGKDRERFAGLGHGATPGRSGPRPHSTLLGPARIALTRESCGGDTRRP